MAKQNGNGKGEMVKHGDGEMVKHEEITPEAFVQGKVEASDLFDLGFQSEIVVSMKKGNGFFGLFLGQGPSIEQENDKTGEVKYMPTWRIQAGKLIGKEDDGTLKYILSRAVGQVVGTYDLNKFFSSHTPGNTLVAVEHLGKQDLPGGRSVNRYNKFFWVDPKLTAIGPALAEVENKTRREAQAQAQAETRPGA